MTVPLTPSELEAFRGTLTTAATQLYLRDGIEALSLRNLAAEAGVSRSTPYSYFASKQEIVDSVRAAGFDRLTARCRAAFAEADGPLPRMKVLGWTVVRFACDEPEIYRLMFSRPVFTGQLSGPLAAALARFREVSRPPLEEAMKGGFVRKGLDADALRRTTWAAFHGLISLHLQGHFESPEQLAADFELLNEIIAYGILTETPPKQRKQTKLRKPPARRRSK
jgi:AcrR family transcriptional regulator